MKFKLMFLLLVMSSVVFAQNETPKNWFNLDLKADGYPGMSTNKAYKELLQGKKSHKVIVAVIDSGVDAEHEDLADVMWVNEDEIAGNGIDDDNNGYIDDIHGWNFIGGKDGRNVNEENLEVVRLYNQYKAEFDGKDVSKLKKKEQALYDKYLEYSKTIEEKRSSMEENVKLFTMIKGVFDTMLKDMGKDKSEVTLEDVENYSSDDPMVGQIAMVLTEQMKSGVSFAALVDDTNDGFNYYNESYNYNYNPDFDAREIVGDNIADKSERIYGNNDVEGPDAMHGTHVAGIIGAIRGNGVGMDGVADNILIMSVRTVPNGDERDKDVANAIRYAVDNGASVINMSFGKGASPYKKVVDDAVRYAVKNDVVLVHAAGNDGKELTLTNNYPSAQYEKKKCFGKKEAYSWIQVGALTPSYDKDFVASFSNYSSSYVDIFAPGQEIYSTIPNNEYKNLQGTSMASPMVAGLAALLRSYYPELSAAQVKDIILESAVPYTELVTQPGTKAMVSFDKLCKTAGAANTYKAVMLAEKTKGKKKA